MKKSAVLFVLLLVMVLLVASCGEQTEDLPLEGNITDLAAEYLTKLSDGDFSGANEYHSAEMRRALPGNRLEETWQGIVAQFGPYQSQTGTRTDEVEDYDLVFVTVNFEKAQVEFRVVFNEDKRIAGFFIESVDDPLADLYSPPDYARTDSFAEEEVTVGSGRWELPGTLTLPLDSAPHPAVVLVHGSGPNDRDETIGPNKPFKDLAWGLASQGVAVLRYDKRTLIHSQSIDPQSLTVQEETVEDALAAAELLKNHPQIDAANIYVLGHSLGATLAPQIGAADGDLAGLILLAGATRPLEDVILEQVEYLTGLNPSLQAEAEREKIAQQVARVKDPNLLPDTPPEKLPLGIPAAYWLDLQDYSPAQTAQGLNMPMLILQGERDYQVTMEDFAGWQEALGSRSDVFLLSYPELNHLFIAGEGKSTPEEYSEPGNVAQTVIDDIASWLRSQTQ
ncbi:alpha/beta hydrolase [Dethiobacter alkaliphilus]|uniref:alpha/beta hydrolase n=1 Tax=Dethiobacter alkaliphilus TaxID=427926 RepID=UPI002227D7F4|nr:alpha/beta fold hydrolase [Dethiobacter alkaliphilus]MCW3490163.1 alpha/beta fold hydrolase [Dethiobacter alkaliphilus]